FYIYFPYVILLSLLLLGEFIEKKQPKSWAAIIFFAPITAPYFIFRTKKEEGITWIMIFIASFSAVIAGETALYVFKKEKLKYIDHPPVIRQTLRMADELQKTTEKFDSAIIQLEEMGRIISGLDKIGETIEYIGIVRLAGNKNKEMVSKLINHIDKYKGYFNQKNVKWVFLIEEYYKNNVIRLHLDSFEEYLNSFEDILRFSHKNFYQISKIEDPKFLRNYDAYYLKYRRASEKFSKYNLHRNEYQNQLVKDYPKIEIYLPGVRQTDVFSIREKSPIRFF
ncbi:MAG: hypothetical protein KAR45_11790, partial [Desulfobacteraceae bacterium]|nr:hypothetical protein [Desulfobacteraceae bacterium]